MKLFKAVTAICLTAGFFFSITSFNASTVGYTSGSGLTNNLELGNVEFKITNNTSSEFKYCVNGGHNYISSGSTKSFSYSNGQDFYYIEGSSCGKAWFEVSNDMNGKDYKLTELL